MRISRFPPGQADIKEREEKRKKKQGKQPAAAAASAAAEGGGGGARRVDRAVPGRGAFRVHEGYDVKLMQAEIKDGRNNNKFYIIQVPHLRLRSWRRELQTP